MQKYTEPILREIVSSQFCGTGEKDDIACYTPELLKKFLLSSLRTVVEQVLKDVRPEEKEIPSKDDDSYYPVWVDGYNSALADFDKQAEIIKNK